MRRKQEIPRSHAVNLSRKFNPTESIRSVLTLTALETAWRSGAAIGNGQMEGRREKKEGGAEEGRIDLVHHGLPHIFLLRASNFQIHPRVRQVWRQVWLHPARAASCDCESEHENIFLVVELKS